MAPKQKKQAPAEGASGSASNDGGKRAATDTEVPVPARMAKKSEPEPPSQQPSSQQTGFKKPKLPPSTGKDADKVGRDIMTQVVPWVNQELECFLCGENKLEPEQRLVNLAPLNIREGSQKSFGKSYKEHWVPENCKTSMEQSGLYEAGGVLFWLDPEVSSLQLSIPSIDVPWSSICDIAETQFDQVSVEGSDRKRILFPVVLSANWAGTIPEQGYPTRLIALAGHSFIYGWYVKMFHALDMKNFSLVWQLVEAALTVTLSV